MEKEIRIMNITNGDEVNQHWDTRAEAEEWINDQDFPMNFQIMDNL